ncbi:DNA-binding transcriptional regulator GbsR (MarR family) [Paenibacillus sp. PastF-3]|uniref:hypothetical protein n=1 Tax=Paenibacillus sp. PastF-3 TaxID=2940626 RepID=UPI0024748759|nr:hypothetical protein [Paenibacillus sp. PastF-3]MDH6370575.1 DNA-binding transcriptional regulator GbsR (MarR family) [Paenibacillus sp. PastF-3]
MPTDSFPFPIFSGLFSPQHYEKIGSAIWLFAWCVSSTTKEVEEDGTVWGLVLGGKPMKLSEIGENFGVTDKSISRWISDLQNHGYIHIIRAPRGLIIRVRKSKKGILKRSDKNVSSSNSDQTKMSDQSTSDQTKTSDHEAILPSDQTILSDAKDIKDLITTTTIIKNEFSEEIIPDPKTDGMVAILNAYCKLHDKFDIHVSTNDREAMGKMVAAGMPVPFTITTMESQYKAKRKREGEDFEQPNSFTYYVKGLKSAWRNANKTTKPKGSITQTPLPAPPQRLTKQQQELADLKRRAKEAKQLEESTSY